MKLSGFLNIVLGAALIGVGALYLTNKQETAGSQQQTANSPQTAEAVLHNIETRASVRTFKNDPVPDAVIEKLLKAGMAAPSAMNAQPWQFIVIRDRGILSSLSLASQHTGLLANAPLAIAVCGDLQKKAQVEEGIYWSHDACAATENILLAAHALGLGAVWTGSYPLESRYKLAMKTLSLPEHIVPVSIIAVGYPALPVEPKDKWNPQNVSYQ